MQLVKELNKVAILKTIFIILSIPLLVQLMYYMNLFGIYFGTAVRRLIFYWPC